MIHRTVKVTSRNVCGVLSAVLMALCLTPSIGQGEPISDLESKANEFISHAQALYRLDDDSRNAIWETYCGEVDPSYPKSTQYAALLGQELQSREQKQFDQLVRGELPPLVQTAKELLNDDETRDKAQEILDALKKVEENLLKLSNGVVLKGSNHPFTQFALEYGKKRHDDMCEKLDESKTEVCNVGFKGADGRPDLVTVRQNRLVVYEFKPNSREGEGAGENQLKRYREPVQSYYQQFFPNGRDGEFNGAPDDEHGGKKILEVLKQSKEAWSSDGKYLEVVPILELYDRCDKKFD